MHLHLRNDSPSFHPVHPLIRAFGPRVLHHAKGRGHLASLDDNLLVVCSSIHKNFHQWMGRRPCEPKDFVDYLLHNELGHFQGSATTQSREERRQQQLMQKLELLQARFEGNHLLY